MAILKQDAEKARQEIAKELTALKGELDAKLEKLQIELSGIQQNINQFEENIEYTCYILETLRNKMMTCQRELGNEKTGKLLIKWEKPWDALSLIP